MKSNCFYSQLNYPLSRTAIEAEILFVARIMQVRFLKRLSGKTPREQSSSGKKIGAESAVLHFVFFIVIVNKMQQSAQKARNKNNKSSLPEVFPLTIGSGKTVPFEKRHAGCEEREKINRRRIYDTLRINLFEATKQTACIFSKGEMDEETGLYYYGARYLDPKYSRWLSGDPALGEYVSGTEKGEGGIYNGINFNLYHYANNNPVKYTDPNGEWAHIVVGAAIGAGVGAISAWASGASGREIVAAAVGGAVTGGMAAATCGMSLGATIAGSAMAGTAGYLAENIVAGKQATVQGTVMSGASGAAAVMAGAIVDKAVGVLSNTLNNVISSVPDKINKSIAGTKTYQTYTKTNSTTGEVYSGRTSGTRSPVENIRIRDMKHHMNDKGFGPAVLDKSSTNAAAIRGREQQLIDMNGGAKSIGGGIRQCY